MILIYTLFKINEKIDQKNFISPLKIKSKYAGIIFEYKRPI